MRQRKRTPDGRNRITKQRKDPNAWRKGNFQILGNIGSGHYQTCGNERKKIKKSISGERGKNSKVNYITEISSKGKIPGLS